MENREIADILDDTARLMELHGANEFAARSVRNAAFSISRMIEPIGSVAPDKLDTISGIGKSIGKKISEIIATGTLLERENYLGQTPVGILEMMDIKGLGPKKVAKLWKELGVESAGELLYACNENRLVSLKGFGEKTQDQVRKMLEFTIGNKGWVHYAAIEHLAIQGLEYFRSSKLFELIELTGSVRRKCEVVRELSYVAVIAVSPAELKKSLSIKNLFGDVLVETVDSKITFESAAGIPVSIYLVAKNRFPLEWILTTGSEQHLEMLQGQPGWNKAQTGVFNTESDIYNEVGLAFLPPELREGAGEVTFAAKHSIPELIELKDLKGCLHNHSTWSDGLNSLRDMAVACRALGLEYFGICDHSKSAFYANGLSEERVFQEQEEIKSLNAEMAPFRIFSGIESDILHDGNLDYNDAVLATFDFIVASVHSGLRMTEQKATERLLRAVENPFTTILGHPTGRLLLAREGYPVDHREVIDACARRGVVIELNAHPYRLDLDWRWIAYAREQGVMISINPDAHQVAGLNDMHFGICVARKGMLTAAGTFNALSRDAVSAWFANRRKQYPTS